MKKRKKNPEISNLTIENIEFHGKGIAKHEGKVIFVADTLPGDRVDVQILKSKAQYAEAKAIRFHESSKHRIEPFCKHFGTCGGCKWQNLSYDQQLAFKQQFVEDAMQHIGKLNQLTISPIVPCQKTQFFRNKLEYTFSNANWLSIAQIESDEKFEHRNALGFHIPKRFDKVLDIDTCWLQNELSNQVRNFIKDFAIAHQLAFFDIKAQKGLLRNLTVRTSETGENMLLLSVFENDTPNIEKLLQAVKTKFPEFSSIQYVVNSGVNDSIHAFPIICFHGQSFITENLGHLKLKISAKSFFQTNTLQAKNLYDLVTEMAAIQKTDTVYDLYTGIGSIALYIAQHCFKVVGIEQVQDAVIDAKNNADFNHITNVDFFTGDVKDILNPEFYQKFPAPDLLITDPPRAGMHQHVVNALLALEVPKIIYISCNPSTQARDLALLNEKYLIEKIQPVDMFPHTHHIESVALLRLKK